MRMPWKEQGSSPGLAYLRPHWRAAIIISYLPGPSFIQLSPSTQGSPASSLRLFSVAPAASAVSSSPPANDFPTPDSRPLSPLPSMRISSLWLRCVSHSDCSMPRHLITEIKLTLMGVLQLIPVLTSPENAFQWLAGETHAYIHLRTLPSSPLSLHISSSVSAEMEARGPFSCQQAEEAMRAFRTGAGRILGAANFSP